MLGRDECGRVEVCARDGVCTTGAEEVQGASSPSAVRLFPAAVGRRELRSAVSSCCGRIVRAACGIQARVQRGVMMENLSGGRGDGAGDAQSEYSPLGCLALPTAVHHRDVSAAHCCSRAGQRDPLGASKRHSGAAVVSTHYNEDTMRGQAMPSDCNMG